jgi:hypothetical protein
LLPLKFKEQIKLSHIKKAHPQYAEELAIKKVMGMIKNYAHFKQY